MTIKKQLIKRTIGADTVLVPVGKTVLESNGLFMLNELGSFIWDILPQVETEEEICQAVLAEYEVSAQQVATDVSEFLNKLRELNIL